MRRWRCARIGDVHHVDAGMELEQLGRKMRQRAGAWGRVVEHARARFGIGDEFLQRAHAHVGPDGIDHREGRELGDRVEVLHRIVVHLVIKARIDHEAGRRHQERIAIRACARDVAVADAAAGAAAVLDHDRLPQPLRERLLDRAHHDVIGAAGRERHHDGDGTLRVVRNSGGGRADRCKRDDKSYDPKM